MAWGVMLGAAQGTWGHLPHTFALGSFVSGSPAREGKTRASFGRWGDSFPRRNETEQEWISNELGKGIRKGRAAPGTAQPCGRMAPFPALLGESRGKPGAPRVGQGCGGIWGAFGPCWEFIDPGRVHVGKGKLRHSLSAGQREFQGRLPAGISWIQRGQAAKSRSRMDPGCFPGEAGRAVSVSGSWRRSLGDRSFGNARECGISPGTEGRRAGQVFGLGQRGCKLPAQPQAPCVARREPRLCPVPSAGCSGAAAAAGPGQSGALSTGLRCSRAGDGITPPPATAGHVGPGGATSLRPVAPPAPLP